MKTKLIFLILFLITDFCHAQKLPSLIPYRKGDLWGFSDSAGKILVRPQFDKPGRGEGDFGFVDYDTVHFIFNKEGKLLYKSANDSLIDSLADRGIEVRNNPEYSTIFRHLKRKYSYFDYLNDGKGYIVGNPIKSNKKKRVYGALDLNGKIIFPIENDTFDLKMGQYISFGKDGKFSNYFTFQHKFAYKYFPEEEDEQVVFRSNFVVKYANRFDIDAKVYNRFGKLILPDTFKNSSLKIYENNGYAILRLSRDFVLKYAVIDTQGHIIHPFTAHHLLWTTDNNLWETSDKVLLTDVYGHVIKTTKFVAISPLYWFDEPSKKFFLGAINLCNDYNEYVLVDIKGNQLSDIKFQLFNSIYNEGLIPISICDARYHRQIGAIDTTGKLIIPIEYRSPIKPQKDQSIDIPYFRNGLMKVIYHNKEIYISRYNRRYYED